MTPIATRVLRLREPGGDTEVPIKIFAPVRDHLGVGCRFEIGWQGGREIKIGYGHDEVQAILLTMQMIGALPYTSDEHKSGRLYWEAPGRGYGFPVAATIRDLLIGDDRTFFRP